jgi:DnaD/phage-associated family protein
VLPDAVVENYIFLSPELQLKVLLLIAKNNLEDDSPAFLSKYLKKNEDDVKDAIDFWVSEGILISDGEQPKPIKTIEKETKKEPEEEKKEVSSIPIVKPTMEQVEARLKESKELEYLFNEAQKMLGRTIGWDGQSRLLMVHDYYGLPVDVILMMLSYLKETGRTAAVEITKTAKIWAEKDITTHEAANEYIDRMNSANAVFDEIKQHYDIKNERPFARQAQYINEWIEAGFSNALILRAFDEMVEREIKNPSFNYVNGILLNWKKQGVKTTDDVKAFKETKTKIAPKKSKKPTYDIEKVKQRNKSKRLKYEKKVND